MDIISTYKYLLCFCKNNWEPNKFLNFKIIILFLLIDLLFLFNAVDWDGRGWNHWSATDFLLPWMWAQFLFICLILCFFYLICQIEMHNFCSAYHVAIPWWGKILQLFPIFIYSFGLNWFLNLKNYVHRLRRILTFVINVYHFEF